MEPRPSASESPDTGTGSITVTHCPRKPPDGTVRGKDLLEGGRDSTAPKISDSPTWTQERIPDQ